MKQQAKLYHEYQKWVQKQNKVGVAMWRNSYKVWQESQERLREKHNAELKAYNKNNDNLVKEYESLPIWKKWFTEDPRCVFGFGWMDSPRDYSWIISMPFYFPRERESLEGFYNWLAQVKYKESINQTKVEEEIK